MAQVPLPTSLLNKITARVGNLQRTLCSTPETKHFCDPNDAALRWYRAQLQARLNELTWIVKMLGIQLPPPFKPLQ